MRFIPVSNPPNPWHATHVEYVGPPPGSRLTILEDTSRSILSRNNSPDVGFWYSVNPYRGCSHGCVYCYARPSHQYLGLGAGSDFERTLVVKPRAAELLLAQLQHRAWKGDEILMSGDTDCYQPLEASYKLTRACLEVCLRVRNPVAIVTRSALIERDLDVLGELARAGLVHVMISIPVWKESVARALEPYAPAPSRRIRTIQKLVGEGIPVGVNVAPIIPGIGDGDMPTIMEQAAQVGARWAGMIMLRLPGCVQDVFITRLREALPLQAERVLALVRDVRGGKLNDSRFGTRMRGEGPYAQAISNLFHLTAKKTGLDAPTWLERTESRARNPQPSPVQLRLL